MEYVLLDCWGFCVSKSLSQIFIIYASFMTYTHCKALEIPSDLSCKDISTNTCEYKNIQNYKAILKKIMIKHTCSIKLDFYLIHMEERW